jgi:hypothetical protein
MKVKVGRVLKTIPKIRTEKPYEDLKQDPYSLPEVFDPSVDFSLLLVEERKESGSLIFGKKYDGDSGHALVICSSQVVSWSLFQDRYHEYTDCVRRYGRNSYREVEFVLIARGFANDVADFVETYNDRYGGRKAIRLFQY